MFGEITISKMQIVEIISLSSSVCQVTALKQKQQLFSRF